MDSPAARFTLSKSFKVEIIAACNAPEFRSSSAGIDIVRDTVEEDKVDEVGGIDKIVVTGARVGSMDGCAEGIGVGAVGAKVGAVGVGVGSKVGTHSSSQQNV